MKITNLGSNNISQEGIRHSDEQKKSLQINYCVHELFEIVAESKPDNVALCCEIDQISYFDLNLKANQLAHYLQAKGVGPEIIVGIFIDRSIDMIVSILGILKAGGAYLPLDPSYPYSRISFMIDDSQVKIILTKDELSDKIPNQGDVEIISINGESELISKENSSNPVSNSMPNNLAYIIYTSGSTGTPKGVMIEHKGLSNLVREQIKIFDIKPNDKVLQFSSLSFDASVSEIFTTLIAGAILYVPVEYMLQKGSGVIGILKEQKINIVTLPPSILSVLPEDELPELRTLISAGEQCKAEIVKRWGQNRRFLNAYGPTESTVCTTVAECVVNENNPPIGQPISNIRVHLLNNTLTPVNPGEVGELYIGGIGIARGYLNQPELTDAKFIRDPFSPNPLDRLYKTGDLIKRRCDGNLEFVSRIDNQMKIRGFRVELGEIEQVLQQHHLVKDAIVTARNENNKVAGLIAYMVSANNLEQILDKQTVISYLNDHLPEYMIPSTYVWMKDFPRLPNGKVDRNALPQPSRERPRMSSSYSRPKTKVDQSLVEIWSEILFIDQIGIFDNFFELGGNSLQVIQLLAKIDEKFNVNLSAFNFYLNPTISNLANLIEINKSKKPLEEGEILKLCHNPNDRYSPFPLTDLQKVYWVGRNDIFELGNIPTQAYYEFETMYLNIRQFEKAWNKLITRHDMLRCIVLPDGNQIILEDCPPYKIEVFDCTGDELSSNQIRQRLSYEVLGLGKWPLFNICVSIIDGDKKRIHFSYDFSMIDFRSLQIILHELALLYENIDEPLPKLSLSFRDYVLALSNIQDSDIFQKSRSYWLNKLHSLPPAPELPILKIKPNEMNQYFTRKESKLNSESWNQLKSRAAKSGLTPSSVLLAAYASILSVWSKSSRFTINIPIFNRIPIHPEINDIVGDFTSLLLLGVEISNEDTFESIAKRLQADFWQDYDHRFFNGVQVLRKLSRNKGTQNDASMPVVFTSLLETENLNKKQNPLNWIGKIVNCLTQTPQVWIDHQLREENDSLQFNWDVVGSFFPGSLIDDMFRAYCRLLDYLSNSQEAWDSNWTTIAHWLVPKEHLMIQDSVNATQMPLGNDLLQTKFFQHAEKTPAKKAIISSSKTLSYGELGRKANQVANWLLNHGAQPNKLIAVIMEKGWEQIVAVLGILQSGGAYLPIDPWYPEERIQYLINYGQINIVLTQSWISEIFLPEDNLQILCVDDLIVNSFSETSHIPMQSPNDLAYVIFTSGSTGLPKGVMISHQSAVNTIEDINHRFDVTHKDRVFAISALNFDLSVYDIFGTLAAGGTIVLPDVSKSPDPENWLKMIKRHNVTLWNSVPALMKILVEYTKGILKTLPSSLRIILMSGDWIPVNLPSQIRSIQEGDIQIISLGGATEGAIWSILYPILHVDDKWSSIPYGKPLKNQFFRVLNDFLEPCPIWVPGELFIGGVGVAKGYWRDEERTKAQFIYHPRNKEYLYKTGDLGRYLPSGDIEFLGREDFQVKIRGFRIELEEIEAVMIQHPQLKHVVVIAEGESKFNKQLVAYVVPEIKDSISNNDLRVYVESKLPNYMVPTKFMILNEMPLTPTGKVDRKALSTQANNIHIHKSERVYPKTKNEKILAKIWREILQIDEIGIHDDFFENGGDSILAIQAVARANLAGLGFAPVQIFEYSNIFELAKIAKKGKVSNKKDQITITGDVSLLPGQYWFFEQSLKNLHLWVEGHTIYTKPGIDPILLKNVVLELCKHHDCLRTRYFLKNDKWQQEIISKEDVNIFTEIDLSGLSKITQEKRLYEISANLQQSLNFSNGPLLNTSFINFGPEEEGIFLMVGHHLILDGFSWRIVLEDIQTGYQQLLNGKEISFPPKTSAFKRWSERLEAYAQSEEVEEEIDYWHNLLLNNVPSIPADYPGNPRAETVESVYTMISREETYSLINQLPQKYPIRTIDVLLTILAKTFYDWTHESSFLFDLLAHGREQIFDDMNLSRTVGRCTTFFPFYVSFDSNSSLQENLLSIKEQFAAVPHHGFNYGLLRYLNDKYRTSMHVQKTPQAQICFNYVGQFDHALLSQSPFAKISEFHKSQDNYLLGDRKYSIEITAGVIGRQYKMEWCYSNNIYKKTTIEKLANNFMKQLRELIRERSE
ncbi:MAG: amino acid adenylation domain-containing protein [Candidatus Hermodarchaeota archaeon]